MTTDKIDALSALSTQVGGSHYKNMAIQPIEFIQANGIGYMEGNAIKYLCRWRSKNGIEDLKKARHYIDLLIGYEQGKAAPRPAPEVVDRDDGIWTKHDGRPLPSDIRDEQQVDVMFRNGKLGAGAVGQFYWNHKPAGQEYGDHDIIAYRIRKPNV